MIIATSSELGVYSSIPSAEFARVSNGCRESSLRQLLRDSVGTVKRFFHYWGIIWVADNEICSQWRRSTLYTVYGEPCTVTRPLGRNQCPARPAMLNEIDRDRWGGVGRRRTNGAANGKLGLG